MKFYKKHGVRIFALLVIGIAYFFVKPDTLSLAKQNELTSGLSFNKESLYKPVGTPQHIRNVNPYLKHVDAWISSVGSSAAINDFDNDQISNDICHVDPRYNSVSIEQANGESYDPFVFSFNDIRYDDTMAPMGCLPGDINEDGLMDIVVYFWGRTPVAFLQNGKTPLGPESYDTVELVKNEERWFTNAASFADLDGDGHKDLIIGNYFKDGSRILDENARDADSMQDSMSKALNGGENKFLLWQKGSGEKEFDFALQDNVLPVEQSNGWTLALGAADLNNDLLPELYFSNDFGPDRMLLNHSTPGKLDFELVKGEVAGSVPKSSTVGRDSFKGMGVDFADINGDQLMDLYISNIADEYALLESHFMFVSDGNIENFDKGIAPYTNKSEELGLSRSSWGWDSKLIDFNNDGVYEAIQATGFVKGEHNEWAKLQELAMSNDDMLKDPSSWPDISEGSDLSGNDHNPLFLKSESGKFFDVSKSLGIDEPQVTRGIASGDVDGDGDMDFIYANQWEDSYLYTNECNDKCGESITLRLLMPVDESEDKTKLLTPEQALDIKGVDAVGAMVTATLSSGKKLTRFVDGGNGHSGKRSYELHFGLGENEKIVEMNIKWRDSEGKIREDALEVGPGRYTVLLKNGEGENSNG